MVKKNESSFPVEQAPATYFTGDAWIKRFVRNTDIRTNVVKVTFEPGARTNWHTHPKGQILPGKKQHQCFSNTLPGLTGR